MTNLQEKIIKKVRDYKECCLSMGKNKNLQDAVASKSTNSKELQEDKNFISSFEKSQDVLMELFQLLDELDAVEGCVSKR